MFFPYKRLIGSAVLAIVSVFVSAQVQGKVYYLGLSEAGKLPEDWPYGWDTPANWFESYGQVQNEQGKNVWTFSGESPSVFSSEDDFVVPALSSGYTLRDTGGTGKTIEWNGKSLQLGGTWHNKTYVAVLRMTTRGEGTYVKFNNDGLILGGQGRLQPYYGRQQYCVKGTVTVTAEDGEYPAQIQQATSARDISLTFSDKFKGASSVYSAIKSSTNNFTVIFADTTEYYGTLTATNINEDALLTVNFEKDIPGSLIVGTNVTIASVTEGEVVTIGNLTIHEGALLDATIGAFEITGNIVHTGKIRIKVPSFTGESFEPRFANSIRVSATSGLTADSFEFVSENGDVLEDIKVSDVSEDGMLTFTPFKPGYVKLLSGDDGSYSKDNQSSMTNAANWSDGRLPTNPLVDYFAAYNLRTADSSADWTNPTDDFVFGGRSLTISGSNTRLLVCNRSFTCNDLILRNNALFYKRRYSGIQEGEYHNLTVSGTTTVEDGESPFYVGYYETLTLDCSFKGSGTISLSSLGGNSTAAPRGKFAITGTSPEFMGAMVVTIPYNMPGDLSAKTNNITPRFDRNYTTLNLTDKGNLGGELTAVNPKAFTIENMSQVKPADNVTNLTLDDETRGIFIKWVGRLMAEEGQTFTVKSPLAVHGTLWKEGAGTLVLGNPAPTFGADATSETPDADATNRMFCVAAGDVKITSVDAVNGLDVVFTNSASRLVLDLDSEDETFGTYGLRNTKAAVPFAVGGDVTKIPVVLDCTLPPAIGSSRGLVTVASNNGNPGALVSCL